MAVPANVVVASSRANKAEQVSKTIANIAPFETPAVSMAKMVNATARTYEFLIDTLVAASDNKHLDGDVDTIDASPSVTRQSQRMQILKKSAGISGSTSAIETYGVANELAYNMAKKSKELKTDLEKAVVGSQVSTIGSTTAASAMGGLETYIKTNIKYSGTKGSATTPGWASGDTGTVVDVAAGNLNAFTEPMLKDAIQTSWQNGATPTVLLASGANRARVSAFTGVADLYRDTNGKNTASILASASVYISDFSGVEGMRIMPDRHVRSSVALGIDPEYLQIAFLRNYSEYDLAVTGDFRSKTLLCEAGIIPTNEAAHFKIVGLTT
jgi:hypothetical protein